MPATRVSLFNRLRCLSLSKLTSLLCTCVATVPPSPLDAVAVPTEVEMNNFADGHVDGLRALMGTSSAPVGLLFRPNAQA
jgi:hypothetical protein